MIQHTLVLSVSVSSLIIVSQYNVVYCDTAYISTVSQCQFIDNCLTVQCSVFVIQQTLVLSVSVSSLIIVSQYYVVYYDTADISTVSQCQFIDNCLTVQCSVL